MWYFFVALFIVVLCFAVVALAYKPFKKPKVKVIAFLSLFMYATLVYVYSDSNVQAPDVKSGNPEITLTANLAKFFGNVNDTLNMFFPSRGNTHETFHETQNPRAQFFLELFYLLSFLYAVLFLVSLFAAKAMNSLKQYIPSPSRHLFFGAGEPARLLAKDILNNPKGCRKPACWFVLDTRQQDDRQLFDELDAMGAVVFYLDLDAPDAGMKCPTGKGVHHYFFLDDDDDLNVRLATSVLDTLRGQKETTHLYIRTDVEGALFDTVAQDNVELHIFNQSDLTACQFVEQHPMLNCPGIKENIDTDALMVRGRFNLLLLGFGWAGRELLNKCICDAQFVGSTFSATVVDRHLKKKYGHYPVLFDECVREYNLDFNPEGVCDIYVPRFYKWLSNRLRQFNRVIVALGDDKLNIEVSGRIARLFLSDGKMTVDECRGLVFAHVRQRTKYNHYYDNRENTAIPFTVFGNVEGIYKQDEVIAETRDDIAKAVNFVYDRHNVPLFASIDMNAADTLWKGQEKNDEGNYKVATLFDKDSSRAVVQNLDNIARVAGGDAKLEQLIKAEQGDSRAKQKLDILAENEHLRWNAFQFTRGIRCWPLDEISTTNGKQRDTTQKLIRHGCLVPFAQLDAVSEKVNALRRQKNDSRIEDYTEVDRRIIRHFPRFLELKTKKGD